MLLGQFDRALYGSVGPLGARRQDDFSAKNLEQLATFDRHILGKHDLDRVALDAGDHRQRNAGVSRRRFDDGLAGRKGSVGFGVFNHRQRDAVLDRTRRVLAFHLPEDAHIRVRAEYRDVDYRRVAD